VLLFLHFYIGKSLFKRNIFPISIKVGTNISCMIGIQVYSKVPSPLQRGDNHKSAKIG
jgi:hypothetical protein